MRVFLLHGLGRTPLSMALLAARLRRRGHATSSFGYTVTLETFPVIVDRFVDHVGRVLAKERGKPGSPPRYATVGHSLGNLIVRAASPRLPPGLDRMAMLAPPNRSPAVVAALAGHPLLRPVFRTLTRDTGERLGDPEFFADLPRPAVPTLVVAGRCGPRAAWLPFDGEDNDGILKLAETALPDCESLVVHAVHTFLMNRRDVCDAVDAFLAAAPQAAGPERATSPAQ